jgi:predicted transcriptional regulator
VTKKPITDRVIGATADIVAAYISTNVVPVGALAGLIASVHASLKAVASSVGVTLRQPPKPAVAVKASVTADFLICLEDGKRFKSLRRHLMVRYGLTPEQYRAKWNLPASYPMVAPNYAVVRSRLAKSIGLGHKVEKSAESGARRGLMASKLPEKAQPGRTLAPRPSAKPSARR